MELVGLFPPIVKRFTTKIKHAVGDVAAVVVDVDDAVVVVNVDDVVFVAQNLENGDKKRAKFTFRDNMLFNVERVHLRQSVFNVVVAVQLLIIINWGASIFAVVIIQGFDIKMGKNHEYDWKNCNYSLSINTWLKRWFWVLADHNFSGT